MYDRFGLYIGGAWRSPAQAQDVISPVSDQALGAAPAATVGETREAIDAAERGLAAWSALSAWDRATALHAVADAMAARRNEAARMCTAETGKPLAQAEREWALSIDQFRWYAEEARRIYGRVVESRAPGGRIEVVHEPVGIAAAFTAWNFPAVLAARKLAPALAAGCSVILRPSSQTPGTAMVLIDCLHSVGLPEGVVNLVTGSADGTYAPIMADRRVRKVSLTGSTRVGQQMLRDAADTVKKVSMELGGNAPMLVFDDVDLDKVLDMAVPTKFANCGQVCVTPDRFYVHDSRYDAFVDGFARRAAALRLGDGMDPAVQMGPLISARRREEIEAVVADAVARGGEAVTGGRRPSGFNHGNFFEPTVLTGMGDDARAMADENFGPIAAITRFRDEDEAVTRANSTDMGLAAYAFTADPARARRLARGLKAGMVGVNSFALAAAEAPFGGTKFSGMGREGGTEGIHDYLDVKLCQMTV